TVDPNVGNRVTFAGVTDGTSGTVIFSEWVKGTGSTPPNGRPGLNAVYRGGAMTGAAGPPPGTINDALACQSVLPVPAHVPWDSKGDRWTSPLAGRGGGYMHITFPNPNSCVGSTQTTTIGNQLGSLIGPSSSHPGGVNMLFLDGSVKFVKETIAPQP